MKWIFLVISIAFIEGCSSSDHYGSQFETSKFIYVSHTRLCTGVGEDRVDERFSQINWGDYDIRIHGGDVLCQTSKEDERLKRACDTFGFLDSNSIWVKGNHDDDSLELLMASIEEREPFRIVKKGITAFVTLDYFMTDDPFDSDYFAEKLRDLDLKNTKHLVVLTHYLYWTYKHPEMKGLDESVSNVEICEHADWCLFPNDFMEKIYPILSDYREKGLDVICLAGDAGTRRKTFEFKDKNGINFLANGVNNESSADSVLVFQTTADMRLDWKFTALNELID